VVDGEGGEGEEEGGEGGFHCLLGVELGRGVGYEAGEGDDDIIKKGSSTTGDQPPLYLGLSLTRNKKDAVQLREVLELL
jgi:hypothetical protein